MKDWWADQPWRLLQTNLREIDLQSFQANAVDADHGWHHCSCFDNPLGGK